MPRPPSRRPRNVFHLKVKSLSAFSNDKNSTNLYGGRIFLPSSVLGQVIQLFPDDRPDPPSVINIANLFREENEDENRAESSSGEDSTENRPHMLFKITKDGDINPFYVGVLEFTAPPGFAVIPDWMINSLSMSEDNPVKVEYLKKSPPVGESVTFRPCSNEFHEIPDPKSLLESVLRDFSALFIGEVLPIHHGERQLELEVTNCSPEEVIKIIHCDLEVTFEPPTNDDIVDKWPINDENRGIPDFEWEFGRLQFIRQKRQALKK